MYELEKNSLVKFAHLLSYKVLYPSTIQKQNVKLALKFFSETNVAALQCISKDKVDLLPDVQGTCLFLSIIIRSVSYTHLDVYKRQILHLTVIINATAYVINVQNKFIET